MDISKRFLIVLMRIMMFLEIQVPTPLQNARDEAAIIKQLMESKVFHFHGNRSHKSFKAFKSPITREINKDDLKKWMIDRLKRFILINS